MTREDVFGEDGRSRERRWIRLFADTNKISRLALLLSRKKRKKRKLSRDINTGLIEYFFFGWSKKFFEYDHPLSFNS